MRRRVPGRRGRDTLPATGRRFTDIFTYRTVAALAGAVRERTYAAMSPEQIREALAAARATG